MEIVLGLSITGTTARLVLVEGERADGVTIESEVFDTAAPESVPKPRPMARQVRKDVLRAIDSWFGPGRSWIHASRGAHHG